VLRRIWPALFFSTISPGSTDNVPQQWSPPPSVSSLVSLVDSFKKAAILRLDFCGVISDENFVESRFWSLWAWHLPGRYQYRGIGFKLSVHTPLATQPSQPTERFRRFPLPVLIGPVWTARWPAEGAYQYCKEWTRSVCLYTVAGWFEDLFVGLSCRLVWGFSTWGL
jgi:hypothetical protein